MSRFRIGDWTIDGNTLTATRDGVVRHLEPRAHAVVCYLAEHAGDLVTIDDLIRDVWRGAVVTNNAVSRVITLLRKTFDDDAKAPAYIETVSRLGYRLIADVGDADTPVIAAGPLSPDVSSSAEDRGVRPPADSTRRAKYAVALVIACFVAVVVWQLLGGARFSVADHTIAVLPFENATGDPSLDYVAEGAADEIQLTLATSGAFDVRTRAQTRGMTSDAIDARSVGDQLRVGSFVVGRITGADNGLTLSARLVTAPGGDTVWRVDEPLRVETLPQITDRIASEVGTALGVRRVDSRSDATPRYAPDTEAFRLYLRARFVWHRRGLMPLQPAIDQLNEAVSLDPKFARAWSALATAYLSYPGYSPRGHATWALAKPAAEKALQLDPSLAEPYSVLATFEQAANRWADAEALFVEALRRNPNSATAHYWYGEFLAIVGRQHDSARRFRHTMHLDPAYLPPQVNVGYTMLFFGDIAAAARQFDRLWSLGHRNALVQMGRFMAAITARDAGAADIGVELARDDAERNLLLRFARNQQLGLGPDPVLAGEIRDQYDKREDYPIAIWMCARLGAAETAIDLYMSRLDRGKAIELRPLWMPETNYTQARSFPALLERIGLLGYWANHGQSDVCAPSGDGIVCEKAELLPEVLVGILTGGSSAMSDPLKLR